MAVGDYTAVLPPAVLFLGGAAHKGARFPQGPVPSPSNVHTFISRAFLSLLRSMRHSSDMHFSRLAARWRYSIS